MASAPDTEQEETKVTNGEKRFIEAVRKKFPVEPRIPNWEQTVLKDNPPIEVMLSTIKMFDIAVGQDNNVVVQLHKKNGEVSVHGRVLTILPDAISQVETVTSPEIATHGSWAGNVTR